MNKQRVLIDFILREWLLLVSVSGVIVTSVYLSRIPGYSIQDVEIIFILAVLFIAVEGLERSGLIARLSQGIEKGRFLPLKLVCATFFLSMIVTNDVALVVVVPLTLTINTDRKDVLVILEALAANAGSALTPFGNPQNLFIYWFYDVRPDEFVSVIAPLSMFLLALFVLVSVFIRTSSDMKSEFEAKKIRKTAFVYGILLLLVILTVLRVLPVQAGMIVIAYAVIFDRDSLRMDYVLLLTLIGFFGLAENMKSILASNLEHSGHIFIFSALSSQIVSNVPATILFAKFTTQWKALLWGANVGGFGSIVGSLSNLIAYRLYITHESTNNSVAFVTKFVVSGYICFILGIMLYFGIQRFM